MRKSLSILAAVVGISLLPSLANAQERLGDSAMGALAGALVGGPIGLVAGGVVGYTAGPSIASSSENVFITGIKPSENVLSKAHAKPCFLKIILVTN